MPDPAAITRSRSGTPTALIHIKPPRSAFLYCRTGQRGWAMRRYFFHIMDGCVQLDHEGTQLADIWEVRKEAINRTAAYLAMLDSALLFGGPWSITVADETGKTVFSLDFEAHTYDV